MKPTYVVAHLGKRDYYQASVALQEVGRLRLLLTDLYCPGACRMALRALPGRVPSTIAGRSTSGLPWRRVRCSALGARLAFEAAKAVKRGTIGRQRLLDRGLGQAAAREVERSGAGALVYNYYWAGFASEGAHSRAHRAPHILFQAHPLPHQVRRILGEARRLDGLDAAPEDEELMSADEVRSLSRLACTADAAIVPSAFIRRGFEELGYDSKRVHVVPYGGDMGDRLRAGLTPVLRYAEPKAASDGPLRLLWVGRLTYRKAAHVLFEAIRRLPARSVELTLVSEVSGDPTLRRRIPHGVRVLGPISAEQLFRLYAESDAFVMPSLVEGFGMVYLEAMHMGLPIICTENTGGTDVMATGLEGIVVPAGDAELLAGALQTLTGDRRLLSQMALQARETAMGWTWGRFRRGLREAIQLIESVDRNGAGMAWSPATSRPPTGKVTGA